MLHRHRAAGLALAALAFLALAAAPAAAQEAQPAPQAPAPNPHAAPADPDFSDQQLDAFVEVAVEVQQVIAEARPKIAAAEDQEAGKAIVEETNQEITKLIEAQPNLSFDEYRAIALHTRADPEFKAQLDERVRAAIEDAASSTP